VAASPGDCLASPSHARAEYSTPDLARDLDLQPITGYCQLHSAQRDTMTACCIATLAGRMRKTMSGPAARSTSIRIAESSIDNAETARLGPQATRAGSVRAIGAFREAQIVEPFGQVPNSVDSPSSQVGDCGSNGGSGLTRRV
jgi:hypothetical protein